MLLRFIPFRRRAFSTLDATGPMSLALPAKEDEGPTDAERARREAQARPGTAAYMPMRFQRPALQVVTRGSSVFAASLPVSCA